MKSTMSERDMMHTKGTTRQALSLMRALGVNIEKLQAIAGPELLLPGQIEASQEALEQVVRDWQALQEMMHEIDQYIEASRMHVGCAMHRYGRFLPSSEQEDASRSTP